MCSLINSLFFAFNPLTCFAKLSFCPAIKKFQKLQQNFSPQRTKQSSARGYYQGETAFVLWSIGTSDTKQHSRLCWKFDLNFGFTAFFTPRSALVVKFKRNLIVRLRSIATIACSFYNNESLSDSNNFNAPRPQQRGCITHPFAPLCQKMLLCDFLSMMIHLAL